MAMETPLIARQVFFGNPDRVSVRLSPDGASLAWLAPLDGVLNVWVAPRTAPAAARPVTRDTGRGIRFFAWAHTNAHVLYLQDKNGDENWRLFVVTLATAESHDLTPFEGVQAQPLQISPKFPAEILVGLNHRNPQWHDVYRANLLSGELTLLEQNDRFTEFLADDDYHLRAAFQMTPEGALEVFQPAQGGWASWNLIPAEDALTTSPAGFDQSGQTLFWRDSRGRNTAALVAVDCTSGARVLLAEDARADVEHIVFHPTQKHVQAAAFIYDRQRWQILDQALAPDLAYLGTVAEGELEIVSRSLDDQFWVVLYKVDNGPARYYLYHRAARQAKFLFANRQALAGQPLAAMRSVVIKARDGLDLVAYYTLPRGSDSDDDGRPDRPLPLVFMPHGGPWARDYWGYNAWHQWLANRGYAVLCVNFRSSTGLGKAFVNAGNREWGGKVLEDQVDAVRWAIGAGLADPARVAVLGGSFGGYSTLAGLTFFPELYACGVDLVGPSNLITLLESMPPYWKPMLEMFTTRVGDHRTAEGQAQLKAHSPLTYVDRIARPLLIGQGANDPRVKRAESDQIVQAMQAKQIPVIYVLYPDEGHGFVRPENNLSFNAIAEAFLAQHLGGRYEPVGGDFQGATLQVRTGAERVPGLPEALAGR